MAWVKIANLRGPAGYNATGAAEDDAAIAAFIESVVGTTATRAALDDAVAERGREVVGDSTISGRVAAAVDYAPSETPVFIDQSTTGGIDHHAFPSGLTLRDGRHLIMYTSGTSHTTGRSAKRAISADDGATWTTSDTTAWAAGIDEFPDGTLIATCIEMVGGVVGTRVKTSTDAGVTWTNQALFDFGHNGYTYPNDVVVLSHTEALAAVYTNDPGVMGVAVAYTSDRGATWEKRAVLPGSNPSAGGFSEPVMQVFPDGELLLFLRSNDGGTDLSLKLFRSTDFGVTFSAAETILTNSTGRPDVHLTRSGLLVLGYRADPYGGGPLGWAVSTDRGRTWTVRGKFDPTAGMQEVYMNWLDLANGDIGVAYALEALTQDVATLRFMRFARQSTLAPAVSASEEIFISAGEGFAVDATAGHVRGWPTFTYPDSLLRQAAFVARVPKSWKRYSISMLWTVSAGTGNVYWRYDFDQVSAAGTLPIVAGSALAVAAPAANVVKETVMAASVTRSGDYVRVMPTRNGGNVEDTLTADASVLGVKLTRLA